MSSRLLPGGSGALKRLIIEYKAMTEDPTEGIIAAPISDDKFFEWEAVIMGPEGTPYECGLFVARLKFPPDYPLLPPKMTFISKLWHPNIYANGDVCISILHPPGEDPNRYESSAERWSPVQSVEKVLISVMSMLAEPNDESPANIDAAKMWRDNRPLFNKTVEDCVRLSIGV